MANKTYGIFVNQKYTKPDEKQKKYKQFWFNGANKSWFLRCIFTAIKPIIEIMDETDVIKVKIYKSTDVIDEVIIDLENCNKHFGEEE